VTASWPQTDRPSSLLRSVLNALIQAIYPDNQTPANTVGILGTEQNDVIVTTKSQLSDAPISYNFKDLAHTKTPDPSIFGIFFDGVNQNIEEDASVDRITGCWLANLGAADCAQVRATSKEAKPLVANAAAARFLASDRLTLGAPSRAPQLGVAFDLPLDFGGREPKTIVVSQADGHGEVISAAVVRRNGGTATARIVPQRIGPMTFTVAATFADGGAAIRRLKADIRPSATPPATFSAGRGPVVIMLKSTEPVATLQPEATYPDVGTILIPLSQITATVAQATPVISLQNGLIRALKPGQATIEARFAGAVDRIQVIVKPDWD
jgi:hypothetical protein